MINFGKVFAICCLCVAVKASPSQWGSSSSGNQQLEGVPDLETFGKIKYPKYNILDLGEYSHDHLPGDEIKVIKESKITIPQPYPVKIPVPHPYPVHIEKPYPVHETKIVKVPYPVPQIVEKKIPYPVEVPKPYPVPVHSHESDHGDALSQLQGSGGYGGNIGGHQAVESNSYGVEEQHAELPSNEGVEYSIGGGSNPYEPKSLEVDTSGQSEGWQPIGEEEEHN
ncbi:uncharacterized protein LOC126738187 isoform X2 [Anthonomus grandis grandis]|uniref:uncharacterized protein LOC126738187 isoform X2 n=1 Tax=Anthonomus grandis grandis TaxID=2921223 RepID=UPI00216601BE|nr:uncharacterized protein LOC126738187 isoform X2 [Anthonomus grandis grandis]